MAKKNTKTTNQSEAEGFDRLAVPITDNAAEGATDFVERTDGKKMRRKISQVEKHHRVQQVVNWLLDGCSSGEVVRRGQQKWGLSSRPVQKYIQAARQQIEASAGAEIKGALTLSLNRLTELYFAALKEGDHKTCLDIIKTQNRMLGLNAPEKLETANVSDFNSKELKDQLVEIGGILERAAQAEVDLPN